VRQLQASNFWVLALGGLAGALARWGVEEGLSQGVLIANTAGSALLGAVVADWLLLFKSAPADVSPSNSSPSRASHFPTSHPESHDLWPTAAKRMLLLDLLTSFCGSFTTFSALALVAAEHIDGGNAAAGVWSLVLSFGLGLPASWAGFAFWKKRATWQ